MNSGSQYIIRFKGLSEGSHNFEFNISKDFFSEFANLEAKEGILEAGIGMIKKSHFITLDIVIKGTVNIQCDRCLEYFDLPLEHHSKLIIKFSETDTGQSDDMIILTPNDNEIDLKHYLYECISLAIPYRKVHPDSDNGESLCKKEMLQRIHEFEVKKTEETSKTNWEKLKYFFENNN